MQTCCLSNAYFVSAETLYEAANNKTAAYKITRNGYVTPNFLNGGKEETRRSKAKKTSDKLFGNVSDRDVSKQTYVKEHTQARHHHW